MKVIASDLDRTLIPNGSNVLSSGAMEMFKRELKRNKVRLVFVTGRNKRLVLDGVKRYGLPWPDFCIGMIATKIFDCRSGEMVEDYCWDKVLAKDWKDFRRERIAEILKPMRSLREQEKPKLNEFKQSYYVSLRVDREKLVREVEARLKSAGIRVRVIYSVEPRSRVGLLDVVPWHGVKSEALKFVLKKMKVKEKDVMFAGDSGNDVQAIVSGFDSVVVKNSPDWVKALVRSKLKGRAKEKVYFAQGGFRGLNGNYVSGVIEGAFHFGVFR